MAYHFLPLFLLAGLLLSPYSSALNPCNTSDKLALLSFKRSLGDPDALSSWTNDTDCCLNWLGSDCEPSGRVTTIIIIRMQLSKPTPLPPSVGDLQFLENLIIRRSRNITGPLPQELTKLKNLKTLWMDRNTLTGSVPSFLAKLTNLTNLGLSFNKLTGPIPKSLSVLKITQIDLSSNKLSGDASILFPNSGTLTFMNLSRNLFEFDISKAKLLVNALFLDLSHNRIYGKIPKKLDQLKNLIFFDVSYNRLCGPIPQGGFLGNRTESAYIQNRCLCGNPLPKCK